MKHMDHMNKKKTPGQIVHIMIDRPMNSYHPEHKELFYPVKEFTGKVIAIIHRLNDVEDKWVAVPEDMTMTAQEIMEQVQFQEQYFETEIEMLE